MKNVFNKTFKIIIICFALILSSCEKELYEQSIIKNKSSKTEMLRGKEAEKVALRLKKILSSQNSLSSNEFARTISLNIGNISYDEILKIIDTYGKENYTLKIELPEETNLKFANIVLQEKDAYTTIKLIEYSMTEQFAQEFKQHKDITQFEGTIKFTPIYSDNPCPEPEVIVHVLDIPSSNAGNSGYVVPSNGGVGGGSAATPGINIYFFLTLVTIEIPSSSGSGDNTGVANYTCPPNYHYDPTVRDCVPDVVANKIQIHNPTVQPIESEQPCSPETEIGILIPLDDCSKDFLNDLGDEQQDWMYQQQINNSPFYWDILNYVAEDENGCSEEKNTFVKEALNGIVIDSCGVFIPESIDNQITTTLPQCIDNIVNTLKSLENGKFGKIIYKFSGTNPIPLNFNWKIQLGPLTANNPANTFPTIQPGNTALTTLNQEYINISTDLSIAKTLIHECFHAYLVSIYRFKNIDKSYINLVDTYYSQFNNNLNDTHHHIFTLENMVNEIAIALKEFGELKGYNLPQQFYNDLAWGGLAGTSAFNENLTEDEKDRILEVISSEYNNNNSPKGMKACP